MAATKKYWVEFRLHRATVEVPDLPEGDELDKALEKAAAGVDLDELVIEWDAGEL